MATKEIFLSYGREDETVPFVSKLQQDLERNGFGVWLDSKDIPAGRQVVLTVHPTTASFLCHMRVGSDWYAAIGIGLHRCEALIAVITTKYIDSRYCTA